MFPGQGKAVSVPLFSLCLCCGVLWVLGVPAARLTSALDRDLFWNSAGSFLSLGMGFQEMGLS